MRPCVARPDGSLEVLGGLRPAAQSGSRLVPMTADAVVPLPEGATLMHLPDRTAVTLDARGRAFPAAGFLPVAAVLPVGYLRTLLPAAREEPGRRRLPLFGYAAVAERGGTLVVSAVRTDDLAWWAPALRASSTDLQDALGNARAALPGNRLVDHLAVCALENRCYTAQNTLLRQYEGALPASPACNADCLGCISLQSDGEAPAPQPRMRFAPTAVELVELATYHLRGDEAAIVSFGQGCEGEPLTRDDVLVEATAEIRRRHPAASIHINTNGSRPRMLQRLVEAGCNSVRISAISFSDSVFRAYYRPVGYGLDDVVTCGQVMAAAGGQVCVNLLTFPGVTDAPEEMERTVAACVDMRVHQVQWRSLNVDPGWLIAVLEQRGHDLGRGIGLTAAMEQMRHRLPGVEHGNFTRPHEGGSVRQVGV